MAEARYWRNVATYVRRWRRRLAPFAVAAVLAIIATALAPLPAFANTNTTTNVISSANPSVYAQFVTFTATVSAVSGSVTPTGTVTFASNGTTLGSVALSNGVATFTVTSLAVGASSITATYSGNGTFNASTSTTLVQTVAKASTVTSVVSSANPSVVGQAVTFTATVAVTAPSSGFPDGGSVTFFDGSTSIGSGAISPTNGTVSFTITTLASGSHTITASYSGDGNFNASTSTALTQTVAQTGTTTSVSSSVNPSVYGQPVTFTASVSQISGSTTPTGTVTFFNDGSPLGSASLDNGVASFTVLPLAAGTSNITVTYNGSSAFSASTSGTLMQTVIKAGTVANLVSSANPSVFRQSVTFTATVSAAAPSSGFPDGGSVSFFVDGSNIGTSALNTSNGTATWTASSVAVGSHTITATYGGDANFNAGSAALTQTVNKAGMAASIVSSVNPSALGQSVTFTASVAATAPSSGVPDGGSVTFFDGSTSIGSSAVNTANGTAAWTTSSLALGSHTITATYGGDANFNAGSVTLANPQVVANATSLFVNAENGTDTGNCSQTAPCATLNYALSETTGGAMITIEKGGSFGPIYLTQPIVINGPADGSASIVWSSVQPGCIGGTAGSCNGNVAANYAVEIVAGASSTIELNNLVIDNGAGTTGAMHIASAAGVTMRGGALRGAAGSAPQLLLMDSSQGSLMQMMFTNCDVGPNAGGGIFLHPSSPASLNINGGQVHDVTFGVKLNSESLGSGSSINVAIDSTELFGFGTYAIVLNALSGGNAAAVVSRSTISQTVANAIYANGPTATALLYNDLITASNTGVQIANGATVTFGNNGIYANTTNVTGTLSGAPAGVGGQMQ